MHDLMRKGHPVTSVHPVPPVAIDSVYKTGTTLSIYLSINLSACLSVRLSVCLSVRRFACLYNVFISSLLHILYFAEVLSRMKARFSNEGPVFYQMKCTF